jgi:hypothetical protein
VEIAGRPTIGGTHAAADAAISGQRTFACGNVVIPTVRLSILGSETIALAVADATSINRKFPHMLDLQKGEIFY